MWWLRICSGAAETEAGCGALLPLQYSLEALEVKGKRKVSKGGSRKD